MCYYIQTHNLHFHRKINGGKLNEIKTIGESQRISRRIKSEIDEEQSYN